MKPKDSKNGLVHFVGLRNNSLGINFHISDVKSCAPFFVYTACRQSLTSLLSVFRVFSTKMAAKNIIITFQKAYQIMKNQSLTSKRQLDKGNTDYEIIEDILDHEGIELIKFSNPNLDSETLVSYC